LRAFLCRYTSSAVPLNLIHRTIGKSIALRQTPRLPYFPPSDKLMQVEHRTPNRFAALSKTTKA
jgi:hypothetical protein